MSNYSDFITQASSGGGGINEIEIKPDEMIFDENDIGVDSGTVFDIFDTVDFAPDSTGSIWFNFNMPDGFDVAKDILFDINYSLNGVDNSKTVILEFLAWAVDSADTPVEGTPDKDVSDTITSSSTNTNAMTNLTLTNSKIDNSDISSTTRRFSCKLTREGGSDTYSGTFQLMSIRIYQN